MKKFFNNLKKKISIYFDEKKFQEDLIFQEAEHLHKHLLETFSVEEQSKIIHLMKDYLENHRLKQIREVEEYLSRLKDDLIKIRQI